MKTSERISNLADTTTKALDEINNTNDKMDRITSAIIALIPIALCIADSLDKIQRLKEEKRNELSF